MADMTIGLVLDCLDPERLAEFWAAALDYDIKGSAGAYVQLKPKSGAGPKLLLQKVPEAKASKNRMHFDMDLSAPGIEDEAARLEALGATRISAEPYDELGMRWVQMADPEGNEFCVCEAC